MPPVLLQPLASAAELAADEAWVVNMVRCWLNEEWMGGPEQEAVHLELAAATGRAYAKLRRQVSSATRASACNRRTNRQRGLLLAFVGSAKLL